MSKRPYLGRTRKDIRDAIFAKQIKIRKDNIPDNWSKEAADFINKLIERKPTNRLGNDGPEEVKQHKWLKGVDWNKLIDK